MPANLENSAVATGLENVSFHSSPKEGNAKECSNYHTVALIAHASKIMLKILQARFQQYVNYELPDVRAGFTSLMAQTVKRLSTVQETWVRSVGWEDSLEKEMATHSSTLA